MKRVKQERIEDLSNIKVEGDFKSAFQMMDEGTESLFVTGKAGTGKSTLLRYFRAKTDKNIVVVAPTGIAAVNVEGQTIHSFFVFPPRIIQKEEVKYLNKDKLFEKIDALVIDEVSMVRADMMDAIDQSLKINTGEMNTPFGGKQVIFIGDLYQLPPVVEKEAKEVLEINYKTPYFFSANVFNDIKIKMFEMKTVYRQKDAGFIDLLNKIRENKCSAADMDKINARIIGAKASKMEGIITLTTVNRVASEINLGKLEKLPDSEHEYEADIYGEFDEKTFPTDKILKLKEQAQVMLLKNDPLKRWFNGTIGYVSYLDEDCVKVEVDGSVYEVKKEKWDKIRYTYDKKGDKIVSEIIGSFEQYPLKLAWAITIHKSQGQTFDNVIIDMERGAFTHGQTYVALSRCRSLDGIFLRQAITGRDIIFDRSIYEIENIFSRV